MSVWISGLQLTKVSILDNADLEALLVHQLLVDITLHGRDGGCISF